MAEELPVTVRTTVWKQQNMTIYFPRMQGFYHLKIQAKVNKIFEKVVRGLIRMQEEQQGTKDFLEMIGLYEIKTNERNVLSMPFTNYAYVEHYAHGLTFMQSVNLDLNTGENLPLSALFKPDSDYIRRLTRLVEVQMNERDIPIINAYPGVSREQDFYIADKSLVLYYQLYDFTPYVYGFPFFPISVYMVEDIVTEDGILGRMIG